jgi:hypothetical protein
MTVLIKEDLENAEYVAVYDERSDGDWELYMVLSQYAIEDDPQQLETLSERFRLIPDITCDFPSIWSDEEDE